MLTYLCKPRARHLAIVLISIVLGLLGGAQFALANEAPVFESISPSSITTLEDINASATVTVTDLDVTDTIQLTASGYNAGLINVTISPGNDLQGTPRTISIVPVADASGGPTTILLTASDGISQTTATLDVSVTAVNDPPQFMTTPADFNIPEDTTSSTHAFQVTDVDGPSLTIGKSSDNPTLLPDANITVINTGGNNYTVQVRGALNQSGTAVVTLSASDGTNTVQDTFTVTITAVNDPPVITVQPGTVSFNEDGSGTTTITVVDAEGGNINLSATSNNPSKVADAGITFVPANPGASGAVRTIQVQGLPDANGTLTVDLTATDPGGETDTTSFNVVITPVNDLPIFSGVGNIQFNEDDTGTLNNVNISDVDGDSLTLSASSGNTAIVANSGIIVNPATAPAGSARSIQVTGLPNKNGVVQINLSVNDNHGGVVQAAFNATILAVPDAPIITYPNAQTILEDTSTGDLPFTIIDPDGDAISAVTPTSFDNLIPTANVTITPLGAGNYTLKALPRPNDAGRWASIRIRADSADNLYDQISFPITVTEVADPPIFVSFPPTQTIVKSSTTGPLSFVSFDGDCYKGGNCVDTSNAVAVSTNTALVPNDSAHIALRTLSTVSVFGDTNTTGVIGITTTRQIIITPTANLTGVAVINVTVTDGTGLKVTRPLTVVVNFTNKAPEFLAQDNELVNTSLFEDSSTNLSFFVQDLDNDVIVASATSSNATLLPPGALTINGTGGSRNLVIAPAANLNGTATVIVSLTDGISTTTRSFLLSVLPVNDAPTISKLAGQTIAFNSSTPAQPFTVGDLETAANALQVSIASSNIAVIPLSDIVLGGTGANRTVQVNSGIVSGNSTVTLTVSDGVSTTSESFVVIVAGNNLPPTISPIADQTIPRNGSVGPLAFTVADDLLPAGSLTVMAASDNQALLPAGSIELAGSGGNRTVRITPAPNVGGTARITLTVTDGTYSVPRGFQITVPTEGHPPVLSPVTPPNPDSRIDAGLPSKPFTFTVTDTDTPLNDLVLSVVSSDPTIVPTSSVTFGGNGANRFIIITPPRAVAGNVTITLILRDSSGVASQSFPVHVWRNVYLGSNLLSFKPFNIESSESNNTYARAMPIVTGIEYSGLVYSNSVGLQDTIDVLTLNLSKGIYRITLSFTGADLDVYLRDVAPGFKTLAKSDTTSNSGPEVITYTETSNTPLTRYIVINLYSGGPGNKAYQFRIDKLS